MGKALLMRHGGASESADVKLYAARITSNGTHNPPSDYDGFSMVTVAVPTDSDVTLERLEVSGNGIYAPEEGVDGFSEVVVAVPNKAPVLQEKTVTTNGEVIADPGYDGLAKVIVNIPNEVKYLISKPVDVTLLASDWVGTTYTLTVSGHGAGDNLKIGIPSSSSAVNAELLKTCALTLSNFENKYTNDTYENTTIYISAIEAPTSDVIVSIYGFEVSEV